MKLSDLSFWVLALLVVQNSSKALLGRSSLKGEQDPYLYSVAVLCGEMLKITVCVAWLLFTEPEKLPQIPGFLWGARKDLLPRLMVPGVVYYVQQNLELVALRHMDAPVFQVMVQMKLITAAAFSVTLLGRKLSRVQWMALLVLCIGVSQSQMEPPKCNNDTSKGMQTDTVGVTATLVLVSLSGFAGVYTEKVLKGPATADVPFCFMQIALAFVSVLLGSVMMMFQDSAALLANGPFYHFNKFTVLTIVVSAAGGLLVAATLKYASSIAKGYAVSVAIITTGISSWYLFGTELSTQFWFGVAIVACSVVLYNEGSQATPVASKAEKEEGNNPLSEHKIEMSVMSDASPSRKSPGLNARAHPKEPTKDPLDAASEAVSMAAATACSLLADNNSDKES